MNNIQDKIRGTFLGIAIGDALGCPVEMWDYARIKAKFGRIQDYQDCSNHKYFPDGGKGMTTDDTALTKAVVRALIDSGEFSLDQIAYEHIKEFAISVRGWGGSTRDSVANLANGINWKLSGMTDKIGRGTGNGISMKVSPIGLYMALTNPKCELPAWSQNIIDLSNLAMMTHRTSIAITSGLAQTFAIFKCFTSTPKNFDKKSFVKMLLGAADLGRQYLPETISDDFQIRFEMLNDYFTTEEIIHSFGSGSCYVYDSLPFSYAFFLRNPMSIESLFDCVSSGGDCDSNGSQLGGLLGALHGTSIFPDHLIEGLQEKDEIIKLADEFYEKFGKYAIPS